MKAKTLFASTLLGLCVCCTNTGCGGGNVAPTPHPQSTVSISISPETAAVLQGGAQTFTAIVTGSINEQVSWSVRERAAGGVISTTGVYTAPSSEGIFHVTATSQADNTKSATATVNVPPVSIAISPTMPIVNEDETQPFTAVVNGAVNTAVYWSIQEGAAGGAITTNGVYTAPPSQGTFHIVATSQADTAKSSIATVTVPPVLYSLRRSPTL